MPMYKGKKYLNNLDEILSKKKKGRNSIKIGKLQTIPKKKR